MSPETYRARTRIIQAVRDFFTSRDYLEITPPILSPRVIPEATIPLFSTAYRIPGADDREAQPLYLLPSPEYYLKQLLSRGWGNLFSISPCFRNQEVLTRAHSLEFTMLEYYSVQKDYRDSIALTQELFASLPLGIQGDSHAPEPPTPSGGSYTAASAWPGPGGLHRNFRILTMEDAFTQILGRDLASAADPDHPDQARTGLAAMASSLDMGVQPDESWDDIFQRIFLTHIEPELPQDRPLVLLDYPYLVPSTAKRKPGTPWAERWELYAGGLEVANVYTEESDPGVTRLFMERELAQLRRQGSPVQGDPEFVSVAGSLPRCSGGALGIDRLVMLALGLDHIAQVTLFPLHRSLDRD